MKTVRFSLVLSLLVSFVLSGCGLLPIVGICRPSAAERISDFTDDVLAKKVLFPLPPRTRIDTVKIDSTKRLVEVHFSDAFSTIPYRNDNVLEVYRQVRSYFADTFDDFAFSIMTLQQPIEQLMPNYFRTDSSQYEKSRLPLVVTRRPPPVMKNTSKPFVPAKGLLNRNIGLWNSHGWYYNGDLDRWEWQRPRLFMMVEDLIPTSFVLPYLVPMLENAGANVFAPRERDFQANEAMVDNDSPTSGYSETSSLGTRWENGPGPGFAVGVPPYGTGVNPFMQGSARIVRSDTVGTAGDSGNRRVCSVHFL